MTLSEKIVELLVSRPGITARQLAKLLGSDKPDINSCLYKLQNEGKAWTNESHQWFLGSRTTAPQNAVHRHTININAPFEQPIVTVPFSPTDEQTLVIEAPPTSHLFVEAGPGTGKTDTLVARLKHLLGAGGLSPSRMLVLSFSVSAVKELKTRIERARVTSDTTIAFIDIRTFDSYASRFLRQFIAPKDLQELNYDERILRAAEELRTNKTAISTLLEIKHVLMDEMQDLVGVRADFALELLRATKPGFTLFGDSAQGIYDFTIESGPSRTTSGDLLKAIRKDFPELDDKHHFTKNFRVGSDSQLENIALHGRTLLLESPDKARAFLEKEFADLTAQGNTGNPAIHSELLCGATCVVCRTNGQVLRLAGELHNRNIPFQMARDKNEFLPPAWLGHVFLGWPYPEPTVRRQEFLVKAQSVLAISETQALELWIGLISSMGNPKAVSFNINDLRAAITDGVVMPEHPLYERDTNVIQLSTIHRSKGREFANVIVVMQSSSDAGQTSGPARGEDKTSDDAEPRVLFVALTRAKKSLHRMEAKAKGIWMPVERWIKSFPNANGLFALTGFQVGLARDIDLNAFALGEPDEVDENQQWLLEKARPGTPVELWLDNVKDGCPGYRIMIAKCEVGRMSPNFGWAVWHTLKNLNKFKPKKFPKRIVGVWVKEITTAVGDIGCEQIDRSLRTSGMWLTLALEGLGNCEWK